MEKGFPSGSKNARLSLVLDPTKEGPIEEGFQKDLWDSQQAYMYGVFATCIQTRHGKQLMGEHPNDAQAVFKYLCQEAETALNAK